jgi:hypothetical protein
MPGASARTTPWRKQRWTDACTQRGRDLNLFFDCPISLEYAMAAVNETTVNRGIVRVLLQELPSAC